MIQQWINGILGLWIVVTPFFNFAADVMFWNLIIVGAVIAVLAFWGAAEHRTRHDRPQYRQRHT